MHNASTVCELPLPNAAAVQVDGPSHFCRNEPTRPLGATLARRKLLRSRGLRVASVSSLEWDDCHLTPAQEGDPRVVSEQKGELQEMEEQEMQQGVQREKLQQIRLQERLQQVQQEMLQQGPKEAAGLGRSRASGGWQHAGTAAPRWSVLQLLEHKLDGAISEEMS